MMIFDDICKDLRMNSDEFGSFNFRTIGCDGLGSEDLFHVAMPDLHVPEPCPIFMSCLFLGVALEVSLPKEITRKGTRGITRDRKWT